MTTQQDVKANNEARFEGLVSRAKEFAGESWFISALAETVAAAEQRSQLEKLNRDFYEASLKKSASDLRVKGMFDLKREGSLRYAGSKHVPDIFETLERRGLVACEFGPRDSSGMAIRTILPTELGKRWLVQYSSTRLEKGEVPARVNTPGEMAHGAEGNAKWDTEVMKWNVKFSSPWEGWFNDDQLEFLQVA
ncbi:hypothetical protein ACYPKM_02340 [Pseudomonas aeruginosa]